MPLPMNAHTASGKEQWIGLAVLLGVVIATCVYSFLIYAPSDDTYIYLVYAKNAVEGHGLTFNGVKVQGFTSVLWMGAITALGFLRVPLPAAANSLSILSGVIAIVFAFLLSRRLGLPTWAALVPPILLASSGDFAFYMGNGLESLGFTAAILVSLYLAYDTNATNVLRSWRLPIVLAVTTLIRPEGVIVAAIVLGYLARHSRHLKSILRTCLLIILFVAPFILATTLYYGHFVPNTYYAKSAPGFTNAGHGLDYFGNFAGWGWPVLLLFLVAIVVAIRRLGLIAPLVTFVVVWTARVIQQGGDNMLGFRVFIPMIPLIYTTIAYGLRRLGPKIVFPVVVAAGSYLVWSYNFAEVTGGAWGLTIQQQQEDWREYFEYRKGVALYLKDNLPRDAVVALNAAGAIPYYSELPTIDMLGLNDPHIARWGNRYYEMPYGHQVGDGDYVLGREPDVILFGGAGSLRGEKFPSDREISESAAFYRHYDRRRLPGGFFGYFRTDR